MKLNRQWLHTFSTLVDVGQFTETAARLHMTQPGVSQHIRKLEAQLGQPLLTRIGKKFELTRAGTVLYQHCQSLMAQEQHLASALLLDNPETGPCRFAMSGTLANQLYPLFLQRQLAHPGLTIAVESAPDQRVLHLLEQDEVELGIMTEPPAQARFESERIGEETLCLVFSASVPKETLSETLLSETGFIDHPNARRNLDSVLPDLPFPIQPETLPVHGYINQLSQILLPVSLGLGFTVLPERTIQESPYNQQLRILHRCVNVRESLYLVRKRHRELPSRYVWFMDCIRQAMQLG
ncbi:LysR family transcriptional regulator (plasmid) [Photobacterium sp. GJ3]|uniref:LysR family transcriptional regulator n=1 Tax=Photobacterium sp. GJ3 TaxID=2829502 RepID=UPI001B8AEDED|nr:LysR family transcriptional regulator [Photobacterium sp. GJ3]QUJ69619.1 LysR family transcriptional regulator [Photobacterium sp. GJ3]